MQVQGIMGVCYLTLLLLLQTDNHAVDRPPELCDF